MKDKQQGITPSQFICEAGEQFCAQNALAMLHRLGIIPAPVIQQTPHGFIVILGPFPRYKQALWWAWKGMEYMEGEEK